MNSRFFRGFGRLFLGLAVVATLALGFGQSAFADELTIDLSNTGTLVMNQAGNDWALVPVGETQTFNGVAITNYGLTDAVSTSSNWAGWKFGSLSYVSSLVVSFNGTPVTLTSTPTWRLGFVSPSGDKFFNVANGVMARWMADGTLNVSYPAAR